MALDMSSFDAALKQHYTDDRVENMVYRRNPLLALVPKYEDFGGKNLPIPIIYGNPQGRSKTFATAQSKGQTSNSKIKDFVLTRTKDYAVATIDNETLEASKGNANAFMEAATTEIDGAINSITRSLAIGLFRDASAQRGQVLATPSNNSTTFQITLAQTQDIVNFEIDQDLVVWSATSGGTQRTCDGSQNVFTVTAVDRTNGILTLSGSYTGSGTMAANDYIFVNGDRGLGISGLESWLPATAPTTGDNFFGVDRSVDTTRLAGLRLNGAGGPIEEVLIEADAMVAREGMAIDHYFMNHKRYGDLKKALGTRVQYVSLQATAQISFTGIQIEGENGPIKVIPDHNCQHSRIWGFDMSMIKFYSLGKAVRVIDTDGLQMLRQASADGVEVRYGFYGNFGIRGPGACINIQV